MAKKMKFCPRCKSKNVQKDFTLFTLVGAPSQWRCLDCGFTGHIFPEAELGSIEKRAIKSSSAKTKPKKKPLRK
jgi:transposase-like protein